MRNAILAGLIAATFVPTLAQAQSAGELRDDRRDVNQQRRDLQQDYRNGAPGAQIRADRRDLAVANREMRQDWRDHRRANPELYRGPAWVGPRGYGYRPVAVGYRFRPEFYDRRYWIDAPRYRLHPVDGPRRWVRYGNDVLLVDTRTGRVLEVNNGFFL